MKTNTGFKTRSLWKAVGFEAIAVLAAVTGVFSQPSLVGGAYTLPPTVWKDAAGRPLPFQSGREIEDFLRTAPIVDDERIPEGITRPRKVLLEQDGIQIYACFRNVKVYRRRMELEGGRVRIDFRDDAIFEVAAYEFGKLLGLNNIPPTVERRIRGRRGTLQIWVPEAMMEKERMKKGIQPPMRWRWTMELQIMRLFDNLIFNDDRNAGNILIDSNWKVWMIDHTRSFRTFKQLPDPKAILFCERTVWSNLKRLDATTVRERLKPYLGSREIKTLLKRRDRALRYIQELIDERGENQVLFSLLPDIPSGPGHQTWVQAGIPSWD
ncbi:MAG: hypothetical protein ACE5JX_15340 [Acidobacteriota bacterium]